MSKIKFNKEWFRDNDIVINCRTGEEVNKFINELAKVEITEWISGNPLENNHYFSKYKEHTCYTLGENYKISYSSIEYFVDDNSIIRFSDLEFEDEIEYNEDDLGYVEKSEPIIEFDPPIKRTILRESVELNNGDVFETIYSNVKSIGIVVDDHVLYNDGTWDSLDVTSNITWIIYGEDIKSMSIGHEISQLLFKNKLDDELEDFITYLIDEPKEIETKIILEVKFSSVSGMSYKYISDNEYISIDDIVSPMSGHHSDLYGTVVCTKWEELTQEQIDTYDKVIKIK